MKTPIFRLVSATVFALATVAAARSAENSSAATTPTTAPQQPTIWHLEKPSEVGGHATTVLGAPMPTDGGSGDALKFDGIRDGVIVPVNPVAGWKEFTVEMLFSPAADGQPEQRVLHFEDNNGSRGLMEIRLTPEGRWALDTFLLSGTNRLTLLDRTKLHPAGKWTWVALRYDGRRMAHFINGEKELDGDLLFAPMGEGQISLGVRLNRVYWFKGSIREVRFTPRALPDSALQRQP